MAWARREDNTDYATYEGRRPDFPHIEGVRFADVPGHQGYAVSSDGFLWSCRNRGGGQRWSSEWRMLSYSISDDGYKSVKLCMGMGQKTRKTCHLHRLVLLAFVGPCPAGMEACHFPDPDRTNCALSNLHWGTRKQNVDERREHGNGNVGQQNPMAKLTTEQVREIRHLIKTGEHEQAIAGKFGVSPTCVNDIKHGRTWSLVA